LAEIAQGLKNEANVAGRTLSVAGDAFLNELGNDARDGRLLRTTAISVPIGIGTEIALARSPTTLKGLIVAAGAVLLAREAYTEGGKAFTFLKNAWNANTEEAQRQLAQTGGTAIGREALTFTESSVALGVGGLTGRWAVATNPMARQISNAVTGRVEYAVRSTIPENWWFSRALGGRALGEDYVSQDGMVNGMRLMQDVRRFDGVESMQVVDPVGRRATAWLPGTPRSAYIMEHRDRDWVSLHTQNSRSPSFNDIFSNNNMNIIVNDNGMTLFAGQKSNWVGARYKAWNILTMPNRDEQISAIAKELPMIRSRRTAARSEGAVGTMVADTAQAKRILTASATDSDAIGAVARSIVAPRREFLHLNFTNQTASIERSTWFERSFGGNWSDRTVVPINYQAAVRAASSIGSADTFSPLLRNLELGNF
jgi:hypothetical protein